MRPENRRERRRKLQEALSAMRAAIAADSYQLSAIIASSAGLHDRCPGCACKYSDVFDKIKFYPSVDRDRILAGSVVVTSEGPIRVCFECANVRYQRRDLPRYQRRILTCTCPECARGRSH